MGILQEISRMKDPETIQIEMTQDESTTGSQIIMEINTGNSLIETTDNKISRIDKMVNEDSIRTNLLDIVITETGEWETDKATAIEVIKIIERDTIMEIRIEIHNGRTGITMSEIREGVMVMAIINTDPQSTMNQHKDKLIACSHVELW